MPGMIANEVFLGTATAYLALKDMGFFDGINQAQSAMQNFSSSTESSMSSLEKLSLTTGSWGMSMTRNVTTPIVNFGKSAVDAFRDTEHAFIGVKKTLDPQKLADSFGIAYDSISELTDEKLAPAYDVLSDAIWDMTQETASSYETIAGVMEMAGQLNVSLGKNGQGIIDFTKNIIMLNDTTDLMGADAAKVLAQMTNILHTSEDDFGKLGATIVDLGNNSATTEADIVSMAKRIAGAGELVSLTDQDILAIAATLQSVGISAEMGGTAFSKVLKKMQTAAETGYQPIIDLTEKTGMSLRELALMSENDSQEFTALASKLGMKKSELKTLIKQGELLENFAEVAGMSAKEFVDTWKDEPVKAVEAFAKGLSNVDENGKSTVQMLQDMGFTEVRLSDMLSRLALAQDGFTENLERANNAWEEGNALEDEASRRYTELNAQISQLSEQWKQFRVEFAEFIVPILKDLMEVASKIISVLKEMPDWLKETLVHAGALLALLGPLALGFSRVLEVIINLKNLFGGLAGLLVGKSSIFSKMLGTCHEMGSCATSTATGIGKVVSVIKTVITKLTGITMVIGGVILAVKNFFDMWNNGWDGLKTILEAIGLAIAAVGAVLLGAPALVAGVVAAFILYISQLAIVIHDNWDSIKKWGHETWESLKEGWQTFKDWFVNLWGNIAEFFKNLGEEIKEAFHDPIGWIKEKWNNFLEWWQGFGDKIKEKWENVWNGIDEFFANFIGNIKDAINNWFDETFGTDGIINSIPDYIRMILNNILTYIYIFIDDSINIIKDLFNILVDIFTLNFDKLKKDLASLWDHVKMKLYDIKEFVKLIFTQIFDMVKFAFGDIGNTVREFFSNLWNNLTEWFQNIVNKVKDFFNNIVDNIKERFEHLRQSIHDAFSKVKETVNNIIENIKEAFNNLIDFLRDIVGKIKDVITNIIDFLKEATQNAVDAVKNFFTNAISTIGDLWNKITDFFSDVFQRIFDFFKENLNKLWDWVKDFPKKFVDIGKEIISNLWEGLKSAWQSVSQWFEEKFSWLGDIVNKIKDTFSGVRDSFSSILPGHANGLDYVPYDNYVARLHKGERVLTKQENEEYSRGRYNTGGDTYNFYNTQPDPYEYARQMKRVKKELLYS